MFLFLSLSHKLSWFFFLISRPVISYIKTNPAPSIFSMNDYSKQDMTYIVKAKYCQSFALHVISKVKRNTRSRWVLHLQGVRIKKSSSNEYSCGNTITKWVMSFSFFWSVIRIHITDLMMWCTGGSLWITGLTAGRSKLLLTSGMQ